MQRFARLADIGLLACSWSIDRAKNSLGVSKTSARRGSRRRGTSAQRTEVLGRPRHNLWRALSCFSLCALASGCSRVFIRLCLSRQERARAQGGDAASRASARSVISMRPIGEPSKAISCPRTQQRFAFRILAVSSPIWTIESSNDSHWSVALQNTLHRPRLETRLDHSQHSTEFQIAKKVGRCRARSRQ